MSRTVKPGLVLREVAGQLMVIAVGEASKSFHGMVKLNETGAYIWRAVADGRDEGAIAAGLVETFGADPGRAAADVRAFLGRMEAEGFLA